MPNRPPKKIVLASGTRPQPGGNSDAASPAGGASPERPRREPQAGGRGSWLLPPLLLASVATATLLVRGNLGGLFGLAFGLFVALGGAWILISVFFPARADRRCPRCGKDALERLDQRTTAGLVCAACDYRDESASAWLLAEEEGPLEPTVLRARGREIPAPESRP